MSEPLFPDGLADDDFPGNLAPGPEVLEDAYPDYNETNSRVISGPLHGTKFPGRDFPTWKAALEWATELAQTKGVKMYKFWTTPGRWYARVGK